ncbi:MAG: DUF4340 domain-containing protein [Candidatus Acidiferrales bacterium]
MKKTTGIIFLIAAALAAFVYFYDLKHTKSNAGADELGLDASSGTADNSKPAFAIAAPDIASLTVERGGATAMFEQRDGTWYMVQPLATRADQSVVGAIASELASDGVTRTLSAGAGGLATYGLNSPSVTLQFAMKNGGKHTLKLGGKDFSGSSVYALVDGGKDVALMSDTILTSSDKSVDDFRDPSVLTLDTNDIASFELQNESGEIDATKDASTSSWKIEKPRTVAADGSAIAGLLSTIATAHVTSFVDDAPGDLAKYGLTHPAVTFHAQLSGGKSAELQVGKKDGTNYFARDTAKAFVFRISDSLYKSLSDKLFDLRDKQLVHVNEDDVTRMEIHGATASLACVKDASNDWTIEAGGDKKSKPENCSSMWYSIRDVRAQDVYDSPTSAMMSQLGKPAVRVLLTEKSGRNTEVRISAASEDSVYARSSDASPVMKIDKQILNELNPSSPSIHD